MKFGLARGKIKDYMKKKIQPKHKKVESLRVRESSQQYLFPNLFPIDPKQRFLQKLKGKGKRYNRYLGSPYYLGKDSTLFRGLYPLRNFPIHHNNFNHELLKDLLLNHKSGFILSYNDSPTIRKWYKESIFHVFKSI